MTRIENKQENILNKTFISKLKFNLASKYVTLYIIYSYLKQLVNSENRKRIKKNNLIYIDNFLAKRI